MKLTTSFLTLVLALVPPVLFAKEGQSVSINSRADNSAPIILISSKYNFERTISLKLKTDPTLGPSEALIRTVSKFGMVDAKGVKITSGFDIDLDSNLIVAFSGGTSEIIKLAGDPSNLEIIASFKDANGNFVSPPLDSLALYTLSGEKLCFDYKTIDKDPKIAIALLLDRSSSMAGHMGDVKATAQNFLNLLPKSALCAVGSFNSNITYTTNQYKSCGSNGWGLGAIKSGGGTDIYNALLSAYGDLAQSDFNGYQKAAIVITDGYTLRDAQKKARLHRDKKDVLSFVYFIGGNKKDDLLGITDHFFAKGSDVKNYLAAYFGAIGSGFNAQKILRVKSCGVK